MYYINKSTYGVIKLLTSEPWVYFSDHLYCKSRLLKRGIFLLGHQQTPYKFPSTDVLFNIIFETV